MRKKRKIPFSSEIFVILCSKQWMDWGGLHEKKQRCVLVVNCVYDVDPMVKNIRRRIVTCVKIQTIPCWNEEEEEEERMWE